MKRIYKTPKAIHVDFHYDVQVTATSGDTAPFGDPNKTGYCQQSNPTSCVIFWNDATYCQSAPLSLRP